MRIFLLLPCVAMLAAAPALAAPPVLNNQVASAETQQGVSASGGGGRPAPQQVQEKKICKELPSSYTRMTQRACLTAAEWKRLQDRADEE